MEPVLILFSGGMDSFLTTCRIIRDGFKAIPILFNNGALAGETNVLHSIKRLTNRYGPNRVLYAGCYNTAALIQNINGYSMSAPWRAMARIYPNLTNAQVMCLNCQTAMWIAAIAYAKSRDIKKIACGYRKTDLFCTGHQGYIDIITTVASQHGIELVFPVWDDDAWQRHPSGDGRKHEMVTQGFEPQVYEPKCMLGVPVSPMSDTVKADMENYVRDTLLPGISQQISRIQAILAKIKLSPSSMTVIDYPVPDGTGSLY